KHHRRAAAGGLTRSRLPSGVWLRLASRLPGWRSRQGRRVASPAWCCWCSVWPPGFSLSFGCRAGPAGRLGPFPERAWSPAAGLHSGKNDFAMLEALDEGAMVTDHSLSPLMANASYLALAEAAGMMGGSDRPPMMSRLFGADPMQSAPMFRLARAAGGGQQRR